MVTIIGAAIGSGGRDIKAAEGPDVIARSEGFQKCLDEGLHLNWKTTIDEHQHPDKLELLRLTLESLASEIKKLAEKKHYFCTIGGDHSAAIGTWTGAALGAGEPIGLIWVDAHKDAHTFETTPSGNLHGMPVAVLLGEGDERYTHLLSHSPSPRILPQNICLVGVRSFEEGESLLLKRLGVRVFDMDEVNKKGIQAVMKEAREHVLKHAKVYGITLDLDSMDPVDAPAVSTPEPNGIHSEELLQVLKDLSSDKNQMGFEIMEFNPSNDIAGKTEALVIRLLRILAEGRKDE